MPPRSQAHQIEGGGDEQMLQPDYIQPDYIQPDVIQPDVIQPTTARSVQVGAACSLGEEALDSCPTVVARRGNHAHQPA